MENSILPVFKRWYLLSSIAVFALGCTSAQVSELSNNIKNGLERDLLGKSEPLPGGLDHVFAPHPYNASLPPDAQYPKLIFSVLQSPPNHSVVFPGFGGSVPSACWRLSARLWKSATEKEDIPPFNACLPGILPQKGTNGDAQASVELYTRWWQSVAKSAPSGRDDPRHPPSTAFPQGLGYIRYFDSSERPAAPYWKSVESWLWAAILYRIDFDTSIISDRRVWIDKYVSVEG